MLWEPLELPLVEADTEAVGLLDGDVEDVPDALGERVHDADGLPLVDAVPNADVLSDSVEDVVELVEELTERDPVVDVVTDTESVGEIVVLSELLAVWDAVTLLEPVSESVSVIVELPHNVTDSLAVLVELSSTVPLWVADCDAVDVWEELLLTVGV